MPSEIKCASTAQENLFLHATDSTNRHYRDLKKQGDELYSKLIVSLGRRQALAHPSKNRPKN